MKNKILSLILFLSHVAFAQTGTTFSGTIESEGATRTYTFYVPRAYDSLNVPVPLVFNMHGATGTSASQEMTEDFRKIADTANFIIVHPQGQSIPLVPGFPINQTGWRVLGTTKEWQIDRNFIIRLLEKMKTEYSIDITRVYATGYSEGGFMSYEFSCFVNGRFAAMASVCGSLIPSHFSACAPSQPIPVMEIHGTNDPTISYTGNGAYVTSTDVETMVSYWVTHNQCNPVPSTIEKLADAVDSATVDSSTVMHYVYTGGTKGTTVELYKVLNGGHTVPSEPPAPTGNPNQDFTAAKEIWRFFSQYNLDSLGVTPETGEPSPVSIANYSNVNDDVVIYPNPTEGAFTVYIENYENTNFQLYTVLGVLVHEETLLKKRSNIAIETMPKGIYTYQLSNKTGIIGNGKLIIE